MVNPSSDRYRLVVLFGGRSAEHDVSRVTAAHVLAAADLGKYDIIPVGITRDGHWIRNDKAIAALGELALDPTATLSLPDALEPAGTEVDPLPVLRSDDPATPIVVLPLLHGPQGEDGTVQGMLELAGVPYVGSGVLGSAVCMDKAMAKVVAEAAGIPQCKWLEYRAGGDTQAIADRVEDELGLPAFVKPANLGSSVGITKAHDRAELLDAIDLALQYDEVLVIEEAVTGREIEIAVLGNEDPQTSVPGEIRPGAEFYDYEDKYVTGAAELVIPADLDDAAAAQVRELAVTAFSALRCSGMARVDFFYEDGGRGWLLNEVNTIPGFTPLSMYPKLWEATGVGYSELIDRLVELAVARHRARVSFSTER
ncbi:D-alanine--D-alanine ligase [Gordonia jinhuaensis]|uniref:D-alanine--D-alanine ligase n=1 Tax=Gordonia jinhuaensis TaxID=1517702 RepID=A0A916WTS2_9ACTN|nr:D-alanine--D-alanine ligase family protein [Gordonia jinhuaensis]GGB28971.1 D-alanine--D-alanine ligase A [Gordonia jinhuaensis]